MLNNIKVHNEFSQLINNLSRGDTKDFIYTMEELNNELRQLTKQSQLSLGFKSKKYAQSINLRDTSHILFKEDNNFFKGEILHSDDFVISTEITLHYATVNKSPIDIEAHKLNLLHLKQKVIYGTYLNLLAKKILNRCIDYSKNRYTFGVPIAKHQMVADTIVIAMSELEGNDLLLGNWSHHLDNDQLHLVPENHFSYMNNQILEVVDLITPVMGAFGISTEEGIKEELSRFYKLSSMGDASNV
ncbi:acyl-CoA dehydrogenase family protein [Priestia koreensis]|uniref:acyl-CoA dehydrogenase family protein n=1 Tax=Priestia koreensis TaxID=284581 RepID=UPI003CFD2249